MKHISSRDNATFKTLRALAESSRERRKQHKTLLDGMHLVAAYCARYGAPEILALSESGLNIPEIRAFLDAHPAMETLVFADVLFGEISPVAGPTGILAAIATPPAPATRELAKSCVLLDAIQDPGNMGSILHSAAAAGIEDVFLSAGCAIAWSPRVLRAAMGAHFTLRIHEHVILETLLANFPGSRICASLRGGQTLYDLDLTGPVAWLFGNEGAGLSTELEALADHAVVIPMPGGAESLNVAAAAAVCLFEEVRQKVSH